MIDLDRAGLPAVASPRLGAALSLVAALALAAPDAAPAVVLVDDSGAEVRLAQPARRIVSLAPGITEMLFAAGAGDRLVGAVDFSDHPPDARQLPRVGNSAAIDLERIAALRADLIVAWPHGAAQRQRRQLQRLGAALFVSDPRSLDDIAGALVAMGRLAGSEAAAEAAALRYRRRLSALRASHDGAGVLRVFVQIWARPLMTVNDRHLISDGLRACGARNALGGQPQLAPAVSLETVVAADPDVILVAASRADGQRVLDPWRAMPHLAAARRARLFTVDADLLSRPAPRVLDAVAQICDHLRTARQPQAR